MSYYIKKQEVGFFDYDQRQEELAKTPIGLDKLKARIDFEIFREELEKTLNYGQGNEGGRRAFDPVLMFKVIVLQKYYGLSEVEMEYQLKDRLSFMRFTGLGLSDKVPDKNTIWVFKERLGEEGMIRLFDMFDSLLVKLGLSGTGGKIIDASFVDVAKQRNSREENEHLKNGTVPKEWKDQPAKLRQKDTDAKWATKNKEQHHGYKNHVKVSAESKIIEKQAVTSANVHDSQVFEELLDKEKDEGVYADSAYASQEHNELLNKLGIENNIHEKGYRNKPLTEEQKQANKVKSKIRVRVEHVFGFQANSMRADFIRTIGKARASFQIGLGNLVYNMFRVMQLGKCVTLTGHVCPQYGI